MTNQHNRCQKASPAVDITPSKRIFKVHQTLPKIMPETLPLSSSLPSPESSRDSKFITSIIYKHRLGLASRILGSALLLSTSTFSHAQTAEVTSLELVGTIDTSPGDSSTAFALDVTVNGDYAYVANRDNLQIINISNRAMPELIGTFTPATAVTDATIIRTVAVSGDYAYLSRGTAGMQIVDISTPASPTAAGIIVVPGSVEDLAISGNLAYLAAGSGQFQIVNITDPANLSITGANTGANTGLDGNANGIAISGRRAYFALSEDFNSLDISNPARPPTEL